MPSDNDRKGESSGASKESSHLPQISESAPLPSATAQMASMSIDANKDDSMSKVVNNNAKTKYINIEPSPLWSGSNKGWQLTWGIWHRLPRDEQKSIALQHGLKSIGEFEEFVSLQQAVDDSEYSMVEVAAASPKQSSAEFCPVESSINPSSEDRTDKIDDDDDDEEQEEEEDVPLESGNAESTSDLSMEELLLVGGKVLVLPAEILHQIG